MLTARLCHQLNSVKTINPYFCKQSRQSSSGSSVEMFNIKQHIMDHLLVYLILVSTKSDSQTTRHIVHDDSADPVLLFGCNAVLVQIKRTKIMNVTWKLQIVPSLKPPLILEPTEKSSNFQRGCD